MVRAVITSVTALLPLIWALLWSSSEGFKKSQKIEKERMLSLPLGCLAQGYQGVDGREGMLEAMGAAYE